MLRIAKSSPGILDLSAVKDESGLPVTLNGESYRDVPDHEEDNPVLQRVRDMQWVTVTRLAVTATEEDVDPSASPAGLVDDSEHSEGQEVEVPTSVEISNGEAPPENIDTQAKIDGLSKSSTKSDTRKTGRRS